MEKKQQSAIRDMIYHLCKRDYAKANEALVNVREQKIQARYASIESKVASESNK